MKKLYTVTFEVDVVVASDSEDAATVRTEAASLMRRERALRDEVRDGVEPTTAQRLKRGPFCVLPDGYDEGCHPFGDDAHTIGELLDAAETS